MGALAVYFFSNLSARESSFWVEPPPSWNRCTVACSCHLGVILGLEAPRRCNHLHQSDVKLQTQGFWLAVSSVALSYADNSDSSFIYRRIPAKTFKAQAALRTVHFSRSRSGKAEALGGVHWFHAALPSDVQRPPPCLFHVEMSHMTFIFFLFTNQETAFFLCDKHVRYTSQSELWGFFFKRLVC